MDLNLFTKNNKIKILEKILERREEWRMPCDKEEGVQRVVTLR